MRNKEFYLNCDGIDLHIKMDFPADDEITESDFETSGKKLPMVIIVHGLTGHMEEDHIAGAAKVFNRKGFATLRVEMYGHGQSKGDFFHHNLLLWQNELIRVIEYAHALPFTGKLYLAGHSQGGATIILAGAIMREYIEAMVPMAPAVVLKDAAWGGEIFGTSFDLKNISENVLVWEKDPISSDYLRINRFLPFEESVKAFDKPVLLIHGTADEAVPYRYSVALEKQFANAKLVTIPDGVHSFAPHLDMAMKAIEDFADELIKLS